jgi:hypothetical protein
LLDRWEALRLLIGWRCSRGDGRGLPGHQPPRTALLDPHLDHSAIYLRADTQDSPGLRLEPDKYPRVIANQKFQMWLMFRPDPSSTSIWVPLRVVHWGWSADTSHNGSGWTVTSSSVISPQQTATTDFPLWSSNAADHEWVPE